MEEEKNMKLKPKTYTQS